MSLEKYQKKRKFERTPEPKGVVEIKKSRGTTSGITPRSDLGSQTGRFVVQEHHARNLHYDFRLELPEDWTEGLVVLKSWAVPKGIPVEKEIKHLAIQTEDHPVEYIDFKGIIPEGNYGAGTVAIFDSGKFAKLKIVGASVRSPKELEFELVGKKLKGDYVMIKTNFAGNKNSWLIFKK